jgi:sulfur carrier protein ThiS
MKIKIKLLTQMKQYLPDSDMPGNTRSVEFKDHPTIREVFSELGIPEDIPKVILLNDRQGRLDDILKEGDAVTVVPPVGGG